MAFKLVVSFIVVLTTFYLIYFVQCLLGTLLYIHTILDRASNFTVNIADYMSITVRHCGVLLWNSLTDEFASATSFAQFKRKIKLIVQLKR